MKISKTTTKLLVVAVLSIAGCGSPEKSVETEKPIVDTVPTPVVKSDTPPSPAPSNPFEPGKKGVWDGNPIVGSPGYRCYDPVEDVSEPCEDVQGARSPEEARAMVRSKAKAHWQQKAQEYTEAEGSRQLGDSYAERMKEKAQGSN